MSAKPRTPDQAPAVTPTLSFVDSCKEYLGSHPEDLILPLKSGCDALSQLSELFMVIADCALDPDKKCRILRLAQMGAYIANDVGGYLDSEHGDMRHRLIEVGLLEEART